MFADRSVLRFIKGNIDGMKIPWCYVGMVFSSFCWHIEDHWSYSINFNHWGEPKTWYGVSRYHAEDFERAMRKHAPELFDQSPDLLHHITTNMNPNILQAEGVPIYRTDQHCGEFVVTFPRAYHAGFNQGFNFAEAVNICLPDWLSIGRECVEHYAEIKRHCVFSNDELLCTLAEVAVGRCRPEDVLQLTNPYMPVLATRSNATRTTTTDLKPKLPPGCSTAGLDISAIAAVHQEFALLLRNERQLRDTAREVGIHCAEKIRFDELPDDTRVCDVCLTTLFLSGVSCACCSNGTRSPIKPDSGGMKRKSNDTESAPELTSSSGEQEQTKSFMVCLKHIDQLCTSCSTSSFKLKYHYTVEELEDLERALANRLKHFYTWRERLERLMMRATGSDLKDKCEPGTSSSSSVDPSFRVKKKEPTDSPTDGPIPPPSDGPDAQITFTELMEQLQAGRSEGYHTDDVFAEAESLVERAQHLIGICSSLGPWISTESRSGGGGGSSNQSGPHPVRFQFRLPAAFNVATGPADTGAKPTFINLQHEMDVNSPRELDLTRLLEACKQLYPVNMMQEPSVQAVKQFLDRLTEWRQLTRATVTAVCRLILTTSTRSLSMVAAGTGASTKRPELDLPTADGSDNEDRASALVTKAVKALQSEFPQFCPRVPEWNTLSLLDQGLKWLCLYQRRQDSDRSTHCSWTLPRLRHHLTRGEALLAQLTQVSNGGANKVTVKSSSPTGVAVQSHSPRVSTSVSCPTMSSSSSLDSAIAPVTRLLRARMHTALGQLSQLVVQVDSLMVILTESLTASGSVPCAELNMVLDQLGNLKITHLVQWDTDETLGDRSANCDGSGGLHVANSSESDEMECPNGTSPVPSDSLHQQQQLAEAWSHHVDSVLASDSRVPVHSRPQLSEAETLLDLGRLLGSTTAIRSVAVRHADNRSCLADSDTFNKKLTELEQSVRTTQTVIDEMTQAVCGNSDPDNKTVLLQMLLPKALTPIEMDKALQEYLEAYAQSPTIAMTAFENILKRHREFTVGLAEASLNENTLCSNCSAHLDSTSTSTNQAVSAVCPLCPLFEKRSPPGSDHVIERMARLWQPEQSTSTRGLLCTPEAVAVQSRSRAISSWLDELATRLDSRRDLVARACKTLGDQWSVKSLPEPIDSVVQAAISDGTEAPAPETSQTAIGQDAHTFAPQLRITIVLGYLVREDLDTSLTALLSAILSASV